MTTLYETNYSQDCTVNGKVNLLKQIYTTYKYNDTDIETYSNITDYILNLYNNIEFNNNNNIEFNNNNNNNIEFNRYDSNKLFWNGNYYKDKKKIMIK